MRLPLIVSAIIATLTAPAYADGLTAIEQLGKSLFFDPTLSINNNQSCSSCHDPSQGFASPDGLVNPAGAVVQGSVIGRFGNRKPPSAAYAANAPIFHHQIEEGSILFVGGAFLDGRATGHVLGSVAADQANKPFLNPVEMAMPHAACVVQQVCSRDNAKTYPVSLAAVWGRKICAIEFPDNLTQLCNDPDAKITIDSDKTLEQIDAAIAGISRAIAAYELSSEVNRFSSRYDRWLAGEARLSEQELAGLKLFEDKALCSECHITDLGPNGEPALFTDYTYDNLGVPRNPDNPWYQQLAFNNAGEDWTDTGLAGFLANDPVYDIISPLQAGKQKVPTLRNVDARSAPDAGRAYMHNGYFKTLEGVVHFYNTRDIWPRCKSALITEADALANTCWPAPEVAENVNSDELGNLKLTDSEVAALVAFLKTLTDQ